MAANVASAIESQSKANTSVEALQSSFLAQIKAMQDALSQIKELKLIETHGQSIEAQIEEAANEDLHQGTYEGFLSDSDYDTEYAYDGGDDSYGNDSSATSADEAESGSSRASHGREWLMNRCLEYLSKTKNTMDIDELSGTLESILTSKTSDIDLQSNIIDILGYEDLDFVAELISNQSTIADGLVYTSIAFLKVLMNFS